VRLVQLPEIAMQALLADDLPRATAAAGVPLTGYFTGPESDWLWRVRVAQIRNDPSSAAWVARAVVDAATGAVVGHAGFHGPPDEVGMVEVGYSVDPVHRRQGFATAMLAELLAWAGREPGVRTVRASISPDNVASLATIRRFGFVGVGEQWDDEDGLELIFEVDARAGEPGARP
jgi:RimJ/RimL family protein N-acetyltransferase